MSQWERQKMVVLEAVKRGELSVSAAARRLKISRRHAIRLKKKYLEGGAGGLTHRLRERPGNRKPAEPVDRQRVLELYRSQYSDFGPTLAAEKLAARDGITVNAETLRRWLTASGDWQARPRRGPHRTRRPRRARFGELVQLDGSIHDWLEGRGPRACLMVMIDDATGRVMLHMAPGESFEAALAIVRKWVERWGIPEAIYTDRNTVYWSDKALHEPQARQRRELHSEWGRVVVGNLGIELIPSYSPQGKGRVERGNQTFQDRLVKELRLCGIGTIEAANAMLDEFADGHNARFAIEPAETIDAHRVFAPRDGRERELAFSVDFERIVARDNTVTFGRQCLQILAQAGAPAPRVRVTLWRAMDGRVRCLWQGRELAIAPFDPEAPKAERFRRRCEQLWAEDANQAEAPGDQSPGPPGILRIEAKAESGRKTKSNKPEQKTGATRAGRPRSASASGAVLGSRPRGALPPARSNPLSRKSKAA